MSTCQLSTTRTVYMRYTSAMGATHVAEHQVWDLDVFLAAKQREAEGENANAMRDATDPNKFVGKAKAEQISLAMFKAARRPAPRKATK